jgi:Ca2+-binding RTX toxin-like protein
LVGGPGYDTLIGPEFETNWLYWIIQESGGTVRTEFSYYAFYSSFENLIGASGQGDIFAVTEASAEPVRVDGGGGINELNYAFVDEITGGAMYFPGPVTIDLQNGSAAGLTGFTNVQIAIGNPNYINTLIGANHSNDWALLYTDSGFVNLIDVGAGDYEFQFQLFRILKGGAENDQFHFAPLESSHPGTSIQRIDGGGGLDTLDYSQYPFDITTVFESSHVRATAGSSPVTGEFASIERLIGTAFDDVYYFGANGSFSGDIDARGGSDTLDYFGFTNSVFVNLTTGTATGVGGGFASIENARGGAAADFLLGNAADNFLIGNGGIDTLLGFGGRDLLFGGAGMDLLFGGDGEDVMIGGSTAYDNFGGYVEPFVKIQKEWTRTDKNYAQRIANLRTGGGLAQVYALNASTVLNDNAIDLLVGGAGQDWFWVTPGLDFALDRTPGEIIN